MGIALTRITLPGIALTSITFPGVAQTRIDTLPRIAPIRITLPRTALTRIQESRWRGRLSQLPAFEPSSVHSDSCFAFSAQRSLLSYFLSSSVCASQRKKIRGRNIYIFFSSFLFVFWCRNLDVNHFGRELGAISRLRSRRRWGSFGRGWCNLEDCISHFGLLFSPSMPYTSVKRC